jgi:phosphoglycolate phosphatase
MSQRANDTQDGRRQAVIFDFDGTIADSFEYVFDYLKKEAGNTSKFTTAELQDLRKMPMRRLALRLGVPVWRLPLTYFKGRQVMRAHMEHVEPFDGMIDVIRQLHEDGYQLFIASSNSSRNIKQLLRQQGVLSCFRTVRSSAGITGKPALIRQLLVRYRLPRRAAWYVGDEMGDVVAASRAGVRSLAVGWGFADPEKLRQLEPDAFAGTPADILRIIGATWKK